MTCSLSYKEINEIQEKIVKLREKVRDSVSYLDANNHRKLNFRYFLSGEVAAYKILNRWHKQMQTREYEPNKENLQTLKEIEILIEYSAKDFEDEEIVDGYEEFNQLLWYNVFSNEFKNKKTIEINIEIIQIFEMVDLISSELNIYRKYPIEIEYSWANDTIEMGGVYAELHKRIMKLPKEMYEVISKVFSETEIMKIHFNLF